MANPPIGRIFSGIQPSGIAHLGNYLGAIRQWVKLQEKCDSVLYSVVDLHSLSVPQAPLLLRHNTKSMTICLLACGVDPVKSILFQQSQVPQHAELMWLLSCRTKSGWLNRMTQWKAKGATADRDLVCLGLFAYPVLMAADVLLYKATHVPVGDDQLQHLELTRDLARSFNSVYGEMFPEPQPLLSDYKRVMSLRNPLQKMSKSDNQEVSRIGLADTPDEIRNKIRRAVTDSMGGITFDPEERPGVSNLVTMYSAITDLTTSQVCSRFEGKQSVDLKDELADILIDVLTPIRGKIQELENSPDHVESVLKTGAERARAIAEENMTAIGKLVGLS